MLVLVRLALILPLYFYTAINANEINAVNNEDRMSTSAVTFQLPLENLLNVLYYARISIGSPPSTFRLAVDTGSHVTWVTKAGCKDSKNKNKTCRSPRFYEPQKSATAAFYDIHDTHDGYSLIYSDSTRVSLEHRKDEVILGYPIDGFRLKAPVPFAAAVMRSDSNYSRADGILGLSKKAFSPSFIENVLDDNFSQSVFTLYFRHCATETCVDSGHLTFGGFDYLHCEDDYEWIPADTSNGKWHIQVESFSVGSAVARNFTALSDSGTSRNYMPSEFLSAFYKELGAEKDGKYYFMRCDSTAEVEFTINGRQYSMAIQNFFFYLGILRGEEYCALATFDRNRWVFGTSMFREFCHVYDLKNERLGLAKIRKFNELYGSPELYAFGIAHHIL
ncbi:unnamed protein product [Bursaphelenchus xylophilus]|uniref:(pine wood nematode) hypothetical protein n=1 Tax=Bursaphelenchus xylophilus TaxID=6326 RepID=A0A7I8WHG2_BURXY|nr:unnamed protein product [Bursaphelenchus xylophilus]CAG9109752.1 unnamed protein product [Bursaphelenchus xylophilus]